MFDENKKERLVCIVQKGTLFAKNFFIKMKFFSLLSFFQSRTKISLTTNKKENL